MWKYYQLLCFPDVNCKENLKQNKEVHIFVNIVLNFRSILIRLMGQRSINTQLHMYMSKKDMFKSLKQNWF